MAGVSPVYKGEGDLDFEGNNRPISVIGHVARLVESLVCSQSIHCLESHDFISHDQSAYLKRHSSLHRMIDDWLENINEGELNRRLRRIFPRGLLPKVYKSYIQSKLEYGLTIWGCTTDTNMGKIQRMQSLAARIITGNFDPIHSRGVDIVRSLHL